MFKGYQEIIEPCFSLIPIETIFTNDGEIDSCYLPLDYYEKKGLKIIKRRFPDGCVKWFEEVQF